MYIPATLFLTSVRRLVTWTTSSICRSKILKPGTEVFFPFGLSGGVDSSVVGVLLQKAIGDQLICIFIDHGLLRKGEADQVMDMLVVSLV